MILFKGTRAQIDEGKKELNKLYANDDFHFCKYETDRHIPQFGEIAQVCA